GAHVPAPRDLPKAPGHAPTVSAAPLARGTDDAMTRSGEIALPDPVPPRAPDSTELSLDAQSPRSGSYALSDIDDDSDADFEAEFAALASPEALRASSHPPEAPHRESSLELEEGPAAESLSARRHAEAPGDAARPEARPEPSSVELYEDEDDPEPLLALFDADDRDATEVSAAAPLAHLAQPARTRSTAARDPDAEFDALYDEATSPSAIPPEAQALEPDGDTADDLLRDLDSQAPPAPLPSEPPSTPGSPEISFAQESARSFSEVDGLDDDLDDPTHVVDRAALGALKEALKEDDNPFASEEELPSAEFEIVMRSEE